MSEENNNNPIDKNMVLFHLIQDSKELEDNIQNQDFVTSIDVVSHILHKADEIQNDTSMEEHKGNPNQGAVDIEVMRMNCDQVSKLIPTIDETSDDFLATAVKNAAFENGKPNWEKLAKQVCCFSKTLSLEGSMICYVADMKPVDVNPKQRAKKDQNHNKRVKAFEQKPDTIDKELPKEKGVDAVNETLKQIMELFKTKGVDHIPYYQLIVHPSDFNKTIQNCFNLSFLSHENALCIENGADGYPQVRFLTKEEKLLNLNDEASQAICVLSMDLCRQMVERYSIVEPLLKIDCD